MNPLPTSRTQRTRLTGLATAGQRGYLGHCLTAAAWLDGPLDLDELTRRVARIPRLHPAVGSVFTGPDRHVLHPGTVALRVLDLPGDDLQVRRDACGTWAAEESDRPIPLGAHPMLRATLLRAGPTDHLLVLAVDPLVCDAWSANRLLETLFDPDDADPQPDEYAQVWSARQDWLAGADGQQAVARRRAAVDDALPAWRLGGVEPGGAGCERYLAVDDDIAAPLRGRVSAERTTLLVIGAAAAALALTGAEQAHLLRATFAARETAAEQTVVGPFAIQAGIRIPAAAGTIRDFLTAVRREVFAALMDQRVPVELLADDAGGSPAGTDLAGTESDGTEPDGTSVALVYLPAELNGGRQTGWRLGGAGASRAAVSLCPTGADLDLFLLEGAPPMRSVGNSTLTVGANSWRTDDDGAVLDLLHRWSAGLAALARESWDTPVGAVRDRLAVRVSGSAS